MMQSDDDVGKIATVTPVLVAKSLELMMQYVLEEAANIAIERNTKTVTPHHLKTCVMNNDSFDFLRDVLKGVQPLEEHHPRKRGKRPRSPAADPARRLRRVRSARKTTAQPPREQEPPEMQEQMQVDAQADAQAQVPEERGEGEPVVPAHVEEHVAAVGRPPVDEDDDYDDDYDDDDDDADARRDAEPARADADAEPRVQQSQNGRMSVSALLS